MSIADPNTVDFITEHPRDNYVALIMIEDSGWAEPARNVQQVQNKLNLYLSYALDGQLRADYPRLGTKRIRIQLDTTTPPPQHIRDFLERIAEACASHGVEFVINELL